MQGASNIKAVYGPVASWRLRRSLGIDPICSKKKACSFNCAYCQLGGGELLCTRKEFITLKKLETDLKAIEGVKADVVTFSGTGEPTLASNLGKMIDFTRTITNLPIAVITNSSFLPFKEVRQILCKADIVVVKLDAPDEAIFQKINRPCKGMHFNEYLKAIKTFREEFHGKFALQIMFIEANKTSADQLASIAKWIDPDEIQINTPLRPCMEKALCRTEMEEIKNAFRGLRNVKCVYDAKLPDVEPINLEEIYKRKRPKP
ncbi:MAG: radical SAM protein [Candidatus Micrarchaeota archaeon]